MDLASKTQELQLKLPIDFFDKIDRYKQHLLKWNKIHNLTGAKDVHTLDRFIYDALYPIKFFPTFESILDIGSGAGFPGMILALALPDTHVTLVEPLTKRASFLQFIKADLNLKNVTVLKKRVENVAPQTYQLITSRAVTDTKMLLELSEHLRDQDTRVLFYKGEHVFDEIDENIVHTILQENNRHYLLIGEFI